MKSLLMTFLMFFILNVPALLVEEEAFFDLDPSQMVADSPQNANSRSKLKKTKAKQKNNKPKKKNKDKPAQNSSQN